MILVDLEVENFLPFRALRVEYPLGLLGVVAEYENEPERSNRGGKSALVVDAWTGLLYGKVRDTPLEQCIHAGAAEAVLRGTVEQAGRRLRIERRITRAGTKLSLDGAEDAGTRRGQEFVDEFVGLTYNEFVLIICFLQGDMHQFLNAGAAEKQKLLAQWLNAGHWTAKEERAAEYATAAEETVRDLETRLAAAREALAQLPQLEEALGEARTARTLAREGADVAAEELDAAKAEERGAADAGAALRTVKAAEETATRAGEALERAEARAVRVRELEARVKELLPVREKAAAAARRAEEARVEKGVAVREREELQAQYEEADNRLTGTCPVLNEPCDRVAPGEGLVQLNERAAAAGKRAQEALSRCRAAEQAYTPLQVQLRELERAEGARDQAKAALQKEGTPEKARQALTQAETALRVAREKLTAGAAERLRAAREKRQAAEETARAEQDKYEQAIRDEAALEERLKAVRERSEGLEELSAAAEDARREAADWKFVQYTFSRRGLPAREVEIAFAEAENDVNYLLEKLRLPVRLDFRPDRELKDWEPACLACGVSFPKGARKPVCEGCGTPRARKRREEPTFALLEGAREQTFKLDSGGGQMLISFAVRVAFARLLARRKNLPMELLLLDEVFGPLDPANREALTAFLRDGLPALGFRQIHLISHTGIKDELPHVLRLVRRAGGFTELTEG